MMLVKALTKYIFSSNEMLFHEFYLDKVKSWEAPKAITFERFSENEMTLLGEALLEMDFPSEFTLREANERLQNGYFLYVAKKGGKIIGFRWSGVNRCYIPYFNATIHLRRDETYGFNTYIHPAYRGMGILNALKEHSFRELRQFGYRRDIGGYFSWNRAIRKAHEKFGSQHIGSVKFGYICTIKYVFNSVRTNKIVFHDGPLSLWRTIYKQSKIRQCQFYIYRFKAHEDQNSRERERRIASRKRVKDQKISVKFLSSDQIGALLPIMGSKSYPYQNVNDLRSRFSAGHRCVAAIEGKQAVGFNWFGGGSIWIPELKKYLELRKNEVLLYDAYVASEWRNQGINSLILEYIQRYSKRGMSDKELILFAHNWNKPVHHLVTRRGFKLSGKIYFGSIFLVPYVIIRAKNIHLTKKK